MASNTSQTPDLASILQTLSALAPPVQSTYPAHTVRSVQNPTGHLQTTQNTRDSNPSVGIMSHVHPAGFHQDLRQEKDRVPCLPEHMYSDHRVHFERDNQQRPIMAEQMRHDAEWYRQEYDRETKQRMEQQQQHNLQQNFVKQKMDEQQNQPKIVDPATIIEWPAGLRCVMKIATQNENIVREIKKVLYHLSSFVGISSLFYARSSVVQV